jgi:hypothetical protein
MTTSYHSRVSRDFTSTRVPRRPDSAPPVEDGGAEWDHPHRAPSPDQDAERAVLHAASRRRAIAWLDGDEEGL